MKTKFNRFAIIPKHCDCCKRYVWLERYRRSDIWHSMVGKYWKENVCKECIDSFLPYIKQDKKGGGIDDE